MKTGLRRPTPGQGWSAPLAERILRRVGTEGPSHPRSAVAGPEAQRRLHAKLLDSVRESVVATDLAGRITFWSRGAEQLYGYLASEALGRAIDSVIVAPGEEADERQRMRQVLETGAWSGEYLQTRKDGSRFWADTFISLVRDAHGRPSGFVGIDRDITDRKRAEAALQESEERLRLALQATAAGFWDWNLATGEVFYSPQWKAFLGYADHEVPPRIEFWEQSVHPQDRPRVRAALQAHLDGHTEHYQCENRLRSRSGRWIWSLDQGRVVERDARGRPLRMVGTDTDVTKRREAEEAQRSLEARVQETQKLESVGVLAGGIAHDFNNLLTAILGNVSLALQAAPAVDDLCASLQEIELAARRAAELTNELLAYAGRSKPAKERLDLSDVVGEMVHLLETVVSRKARFEVTLAPHAGPVEADPAQLRQVVMNLITNASDALGSKPGTVQVRTGMARLSREDVRRLVLGPDLDRGEYAFVEVQDSGCGMSADTQTRMFDPFFSTKFQGRGLGLAALLGIVRGHGGALAVDSKPGQGTRVRVLLPCEGERPEQTARQERAPAAGVWRGGGTILVVDDEAPIRRMTKRLLEEHGFRVELARNGNEALRAFRDRGGQLVAVILDATMPELDGRETFRAMQRMRIDVPVILASGYCLAFEAEGLLEEGVAAFLQKPYEPTALLDTLRTILE